MLSKKAYTTGQLAKALRVAPRTVVKWFDRGLFYGGYRIPGSMDRRIPHEAVKRFCVEHGLPFPFNDTLLVVGNINLDRLTSDRWTVKAINESSAAATLVRASHVADPFLTIVEVSAVGRDGAAQLAAHAPTIAILPEDDAEPIPGALASMQSPVDPTSLRLMVDGYVV